MATESAAVQSGDLRDRPLPDLLMDLGALGQSGTLALKREGLTKTIYIEKGQLIFAASTDPNDRLGEVLVRQRVIGFSDLRRAQGQVKPGLRLGAVMVQEGILPAEGLVDAVLAQVRNIILSCFDWTAGEFVFTPKLEIGKEVIRLDLPVRDLVREGIGRIDDVNRIRKGLDEFEHAWRLTPECEERLANWSLGEPEHQILAQLGTARKFEELAALKLMPEIDLARFLWALEILGIIQVFSEDDLSLDAMMDDAFGGGSHAAPKAPAPAPEPAGALDAPAAPEPAPGETTEVEMADETADAPSAEAAPESGPAPAPEPASEPAPADDTPEEEDFGFTADDLEFGGGMPEPPPTAAPKAVETVAKVEAPADDISHALADFGVHHKALLKILQAKAAEKTGSFIGFCLREVRKSHPRLYQGVEPTANGELPLDKLLANIRTQKLRNYAAGLTELHDVLSRRAKTWQGAETARACREAVGLPPAD